MKVLLEFLGNGGWIIVVTIMMLIFFVYLYRKAIRDGAKEPTGYIKYDTDYPEWIQFDTENLQEYPTEFPELTKDPELNGVNEHWILDKEIDKFMKRRNLRTKLKKIEKDKNINTEFMG